jgi:hypothetical protein
MSGSFFSQGRYPGCDAIERFVKPGYEVTVRRACVGAKGDEHLPDFSSVAGIVEVLKDGAYRVS